MIQKPDWWPKNPYEEGTASYYTWDRASWTIFEIVGRYIDLSADFIPDIQLEEKSNNEEI
jgi:hypothetical protein